MEQQAADALYAKLHEKEPFHDGTFAKWSPDRTLEFPYHFKDGVRIGVTDYDVMPHDPFTTEVNASPVLPASSES